MRVALVLVIYILFSCGEKKQEHKVVQKVTKEKEEVNQLKEKLLEEEQRLEKERKELRQKLLASKPDENLKNSLLAELYLRNLVHRHENTLGFNLVFDLHGFDCGAPDCYRTIIKFKIPYAAPISFPKTIPFSFIEEGCGIEKEISRTGIFQLQEESEIGVNYYSKSEQSNLIIQKEDTQTKLYYFPNIKEGKIQLKSLNQFIESIDETSEESNAPYTSGIMNMYDYSIFLQND
ncbi:hypothetical protein [Tenacibaculum jejuense]|uniref:Lipoprotein n=1 Tax=Tenacibaculum jejuense TaxID=584609 RepID=A0A238UBC2_9FLAO|nr:hypothetical protein [Tenacibaculum jejuense]SNR16507.1 Protein of unknown function [Tenacibaculum jejuense]